MVEGSAIPCASGTRTYPPALVSRALAQPVRTIDTVADINGKPFYELDVVDPSAG